MFISVDAVDPTEKMRAAYDVPFPLLSDPDAKVHDAYRVSKVLTPEEVAKLKKFGHDIPKWSGKGHQKIAIPAMYLIMKDKRLAWAHVDTNYRRRIRAKAILAELERVLKAPTTP